MANDNRIIQGGELGIGQGSLDDVVTDKPASGAEVAAQAQRPKGAFPEVDMAYLNERLMNYLQNAAQGTSIDTSQEKEGEVNVGSVVNDQAVHQIISALGNSFFRIQNPRYVEAKGRQFLAGDLVLNSEIPLKSLKKGITAMIGDEHVDYFLKEFGDRLGITDETKAIDTSRPELQIYLHGISQVQQVGGQYVFLRDPYLLLLTLEPEDRDYATLFFDEAREANAAPFNRDINPRTTEKGWVKVRDYAITQNDIQAITQEPQIVPFSELLRVGKKYDIKGLAEYADRLEKFRETLQNIQQA
jgi:hypothetical protein